MTTNGLNIPVL